MPVEHRRKSLTGLCDWHGWLLPCWTESKGGLTGSQREAGARAGMCCKVSGWLVIQRPSRNVKRKRHEPQIGSGCEKKMLWGRVGSYIIRSRDQQPARAWARVSVFCNASRTVLWQRW